MVCNKFEGFLAPSWLYYSMSRKGFVFNKRTLDYIDISYRGSEIVMHHYVLPFTAINQTHLEQVGGKGANLGELFQIPGIFVPEGFCITTDAYRDFIATSSQLDKLLSELEQLGHEDIDECRQIGLLIRSHLEELPIPLDIQAAVGEIWEQTGSHFSYAIRSSATAEDLPGASFAGQQDSFLNVKGLEAVITHMRKCWASLFTDRAIIYRIQNGFNHRAVLLAVVVQRMIFPELSGIMFTADPVSGNRKITSIDASYGLGEALVSGLVSPDLYQVRAGMVIKKKIADKRLAIYGLGDAGVVKQAIAADKAAKQALPDQVALVLAELGEKIAAHFGSPQDIEWCLADDTVFIVQSRPITTLYPLPHIADHHLHMLFSLGHVQMMTEPMKPLGISVLKTFVPFGKAGNHRSESDLLVEAGGRLYFDATKALDYRIGRKFLPALISNADEFISRAIEEFIHRTDSTFKAGFESISFTLARDIGAFILKVIKTLTFQHEAALKERLEDLLSAKVDENRQKINSKSGIERIRQIQDILPTLLPFVFKNMGPYVAAGVLTFRLINKLADWWLEDVDQELSGISKAPVGNVTSEMGLALGDVADSVRNYPEVIEYLRTAIDAEFITGLNGIEGGQEVQGMLQGFLEKYGMRTTGEIDITRPRWRETPSELVGSILSHVENSKTGEHRIHFRQGELIARQSADQLIERLRYTRWGFLKRKIMSRLIAVYRKVIGLREHPKFFIVQHFDMIKQAILQEAERLVGEQVLRKRDDVFWLTLDDFIAVLEARQVNYDTIAARQEAYERNRKLTPPRAMTSEGEILHGLGRSADMPPDVLIGSPVSVGVVEGRARVVVNLANAKINKGEILVARFTDPGWTPLFPLAAGLVTEAGGLMTHGAVVAREYGIPAVVGVDGATVKIKDGEMIRIDGRKGYVEFIQ